VEKSRRSEASGCVLRAPADEGETLVRLIARSIYPMKTKNDQFQVVVPSLDGLGAAERVRISVPLRWDDELKEWLLTPEAHARIENTKARHMGLLLPAQLKELRDRLGYTQKQMGDLFQVGEKSWTRWETGKHRPSRSINLLIRTLYERKVSLKYLLTRAGQSPGRSLEPSKHPPVSSAELVHTSRNPGK